MAARGRSLGRSGSARDDALGACPLSQGTAWLGAAGERERRAVTMTPAVRRGRPRRPVPRGGRETSCRTGRQTTGTRCE